MTEHALPRAVMLDTNVLYKDTTLTHICKRARDKDIAAQVRVPTLAHGEMLRHLRVEYGEKYSRSIVEAKMESLGIETVPITEDVADSFAALVHRSFPSDDAWQAHKKAHYAARIGVNVEDAAGTGRQCSATVDWFIAACAVHHDCVLVTDDKDAASGFEGVKVLTLRALCEMWGVSLGSE